MTFLLSLPAFRPATLALFVTLCASTPGSAWAQTRGELLYGTHCLTCHNSQMHWREKKQVVDWASLRAQVRRWQATDQLAWSDEDIDHVARYLNETFYRLPPPSQVLASATPAPSRR